MKNLKLRISAILIFVIICAVVYLYIDGYFDVSFIVRGNGDGGDTADTETDAKTNTDTDFGTESSDTDAEDTDTNDEHSTNEGDDTDVPVEYDVMSSGDAESAGYKFSSDDWSGKGWILARADMELPGYFSSHKEDKSVVSYEMVEDKKPYEAVYKTAKRDAPSVKLYMGYIITETDEEGVSNLCTRTGDLLGSFDNVSITPAYCRDGDGEPLFIYKGGYYYFDTKKKSFVQSEYDPHTDSRGVRFDYREDYGTESDGRKFLSRVDVVDVFTPIGKKKDKNGNQLAYRTPTDVYTFALADSKSKALTEYIYYGAYNFSEARAAVLDAEGHLFYINKSGKTVIQPSSRHKDIQLGRTVIDFLMPPITDGEESIGYYYFEHGLVRAHVLTLDSYRYNNYGIIYCVSEEDIMVYDNGDRFPIPVGYDIVSYSSGMILLSCDGKYGYMDYTGKWVVQPVLDYAEPYYEGLAVVGADGKYAMLDTSGEEVIPFGAYSYISHASSGVISAYGGDGWEILYKMHSK